MIDRDDGKLEMPDLFAAPETPEPAQPAEPEPQVQSGTVTPITPMDTMQAMSKTRGSITFNYENTPQQFVTRSNPPQRAVSETDTPQRFVSGTSETEVPQSVINSPEYREAKPHSSPMDIWGIAGAAVGLVLGFVLLFYVDRNVERGWYFPVGGAVIGNRIGKGIYYYLIDKT